MIIKGFSVIECAPDLHHPGGAFLRLPGIAVAHLVNKEEALEQML